MTRATYVMRNGRLVRKDRTTPQRHAGAYVISDDLGQQLEHHGYADGRRTDSKSVFRSWTRAAGLVEKGNDRERTRPLQAPDIRSDVVQAYQMVKAGYRPQIRQFEGE